MGKTLAQELTDGTSEKGRCPNLRTDKVGAYCAKDLNAGELISEMRRMICDTAFCSFVWIQRDARIVFIILVSVSVKFIKHVF